MIRWSPHKYKSDALINGYNPEYLTQTILYANKLYQNNLPIVFSLAHLSKITDTAYNQLYSIVDRTTDPYIQFQMTKRSGGFRQIVVPNFILMKTQRWINQNILSKGIVHSAAYAYVKNKNIKKNAELHCGAKWLIKMDIQRFFESITERQIYKVFKNLGYTNLLALELTRLCTRVTLNKKKIQSKRWQGKGQKYSYYPVQTIGHLPQGAPTSPILSNLIFFELDKKITDIAQKYGCLYTRYSDDFTFSTSDFNRTQSKQFISEISVLLSKNGFRSNHKKTKIIPPGAKKIVTGLIVNVDQPKISKELKIKIENHLYYSKRFGVLSHCEKRNFISIFGFKNHLEGLINYVISIDEVLGVKYKNKFKDIEWPII